VIGRHRAENEPLIPPSGYQQTVSLLQDWTPSTGASGGSGHVSSTIPKSSSFIANVESDSTFPRVTSVPDFGPTFADGITSSSGEMPCAERTTEFRTVCKSLQMKNQANGFRQQKPSKTALLEESAQFNRFAKKIGRDLSQTCAKLEKLAMLAKKKSLFDDRMSEIDELTHIIKQDIAGLNRQIAQLQEFAMNRHGSLITAKNGSQTQHHSKSIVVCLQSKLASVSNEFKQVLEIRTENLKHQRTRREKFTHNQSVPSSLPPSASTGRLGSILLSDDHAARSDGGSVLVDMNNVEQSRAQQQLQLIDEQDAYIRSRSDAMENIESTIVELGQIFNQLAHMVQEQGEMVQRIDSNVEEAALNVEAAHMELLKYFRNISNNRWLALKVFGILIVFFIIFIVFLV